VQCLLMVYNSERCPTMKANENGVITAALLAVCCLPVFVMGIQTSACAEEERSIVGVWLTGEDIDITYSFCADGTFTHWNTYYYFKNGKQINVSRERIGCGTYTTGKDEISNIIDLHFQYETECVALGRFEWTTEPSGELALNIAECGSPRPDSPLYYHMRSGGIFDCTCVSELDCDTSDIQMTNLSGRYGYGLSGEHDFTGSLIKEALTDAEWHLDGKFTFPTGGYAVREPQVSIQESYPEQVSVTLKVIQPAPDSIVTQVITVVPVSLEIPASNQAQFTLKIEVCTEMSSGEGEPVEGESSEGEGEPVEGEATPAVFLLEQFDAADLNNDNRLSFEEALAVLADFSQDEFNRLDTNEDAFLTQAELRANGLSFFSCMNLFRPAEEAKHYLGDLLLLGISLTVLLRFTINNRR